MFQYHPFSGFPSRASLPLTVTILIIITVFLMNSILQEACLDHRTSWRRRAGRTGRCYLK